MPWMVCSTCPKATRFYCPPSMMTDPAQCDECRKPAPAIRQPWEHDRDCLYVLSDGPAACTCPAGRAYP